MKKIYFLLAGCLSFIASLGQTNVTSSEIYMGLRKLNVVGSVLYVAAHPDDENTRLITYLSKDKMYRTGYLSLTRGDGGQNLVGDEQGISLGLIRTQELLAARRIDGGEQFFSRAYDFGYSKTPEETFAKWNREKILSDVVWVIRNFRPDVIITRFPTTGEGGHGHHTASAILANEAFTAAADPKRFPEQLSYVQPWQAKRILWNAFNFGGNAPAGEDILRLDVGGYNAVLGKSYGEIAADSRSQHKSQGFGVARTRGEALEFFKTTGGTAPSTDLFDGVDVSWSRVPGSEGVTKLINQAIDSFDFVRPQSSLPRLLKIYKALLAMPYGPWKAQKTGEVLQLIEQASGLWLEAFTTEPYVAQGDSTRISFVVNSRLDFPIKLNRVSVDKFDSSMKLPLTPNRNVSFGKTLFVHSTYPITQPYWLVNPMAEGHFIVNDQLQIGQPDVDPSFKVRFDVQVGDMELSFLKPVRYKFTDPVKGELYQPLVVLPPASVYADPELLLVKSGTTQAKKFTVQVTANKKLNIDTASLATQLEKKWLDSKDGPLKLPKGGQSAYTFEVRPAETRDQEGRIYSILRMPSEKEQTMALASIKHDHIPWISYVYTDWIKVLPIKLNTYGKRIGYITGAGDKVPEALEQMGYEVTLLGDKELSRNNLRQFDAIISGVRAYNTNEWLNRHYDRLMKYVEDGGNLIVQYNTSNNIGPVKAKMGPYNFNISRNRITDENAPVTFLKPDHSALNFPNKIMQDDFRGWTQERSIYHASAYDPKFEAIISMNDPGEQGDAGSLIIAPHGKGYFTYTGLVFFRQLPAGVPGAYRLLANLIALNQKKAF
jgi:LmbE family N-acetylglucosaminyl deacetylase